MDGTPRIDDTAGGHVAVGQVATAAAAAQHDDEAADDHDDDELHPDFLPDFSFPPAAVHHHHQEQHTPLGPMTTMMRASSERRETQFDHSCNSAGVMVVTSPPVAPIRQEAVNTGTSPVTDTDIQHQREQARNQSDYEPSHQHQHRHEEPQIFVATNDTTRTAISTANKVNAPSPAVAMAQRQQTTATTTRTTATTDTSSTIAFEDQASPQTSASLVQLLNRLKETVEGQSATIQSQAAKIKRQQKTISQLTRALAAASDPKQSAGKTKKRGKNGGTVMLTPAECTALVERNKFERWERRLKELSDFKLAHGHCNVPKSHQPKSLHSWVVKQRMDFKKMEAGLPCNGMNQERADILTRMGFQWTLGLQAKAQEKWDVNYRELMKFMAKNGGSSNVPTSYSAKLNKWVQNQRHRKRLLDTVGPAGAIGMNADRVEKLNDIGFAWDGAKEFKRRPTAMMAANSTPAPAAPLPAPTLTTTVAAATPLQLPLPPPPPPPPQQQQYVQQRTHHHHHHTQQSQQQQQLQQQQLQQHNHHHHHQQQQQHFHQQHMPPIIGPTSPQPLQPPMMVPTHATHQVVGQMEHQHQMGETGLHSI